MSYMADVNTGEGNSFVDLSLEKLGRIEQAVVHLAKAIELDLVDVALDPTIASNGSRERYAQLGSRLAELSGISYELVLDISQATGIAIEGVEAPQSRMGGGEEGQPQPLQAPQPLSLGEGGASASAPEAPALPDPASEAASTPPVAATNQVTTPADSSTQPKEASETEKDPSRLYERIVELEELPEMRPVEEDEAIQLVVWKDNVVKLKGREIKLNRNELFVFNAMLLLRDKPRASGELRALGFEVTGKTPPSVAFGNAVKPLIEKLNRAAGKEIIKKLGERRNTKYAFNPKVVLSDFREEGLDEEASPEGVKKN